jgi:hypothetical protein
MSVIKTVLLNAFPAGGKSEIRKLLSVERDLSTKLMVGEQVQLDDYPYVKFMRDIDDALNALGMPRIFFDLPDRGFISDYEWGTITLLVSEVCLRPSAAEKKEQKIFFSRALRISLLSLFPKCALTSLLCTITGLR